MIKKTKPSHSKGIDQREFSYLKQATTNGHLSFGLSLINRNMEIIWMSGKQQEWFGTLKELKGRHCYEVYQHRRRICPRCPTARTFKTGRICKATIQPGFTHNNGKRYYKLNTTPVTNGNGEVVYVLEMVEDITQRKIAEDYRHAMERELKKANKKLKRLNVKLNVKTCKLSEMAKTVKDLNRNLEKKVNQRSVEILTLNNKLRSLFDLSRSIVSTVEPRELFQTIVKNVAMFMETDACSLRLLARDKKYLIPIATWGLSKNYLLKTPLRVGEGAMGYVAQTAKPLSVDNIATDPRIKYGGVMVKEGICSVAAVPLTFKGQAIGALAVYSARQHNFQDNDLMILSTLASQVATAIKNSELYEKMHLNYLDAISALALAVEARDDYTLGHSERATYYALAIGKRLGLSEKVLRDISYAGKLHDVGKIAISDSVLRKPASLNDREMQQIRYHPVKGCEMILPLKFLHSAMPMIRHHHERYDGKGYPDGLKGEEIPLLARILACVDAFDAMISDRPYRKRMTFQRAREELKANAGSQFDPKIVNVFLSILKDFEDKSTAFSFDYRPA